MTPEQFDRLAAEGYNRIPLMCEVLADLDTPLGVYLKLADGPYSYLFESWPTDPIPTCLNPCRAGRSGGATPLSASLAEPCSR